MSCRFFTTTITLFSLQSLIEVHRWIRINYVSLSVQFSSVVDLITFLIINLQLALLFLFEYFHKMPAVFCYGVHICNEVQICLQISFVIAIIRGFESDGGLVPECMEVWSYWLFGCLFRQFLFFIFGFDFYLMGMFCVHLNCNSKNIIEITFLIILKNLMLY